MSYKPKAAGYKKDVVKQVTKLLNDYPIVAAVDMENMPTPQLQAMKEKLRGKVVLLMAKKRLMKIALEAVKDKKKGIEELENRFQGMPALMFTKENPFTIYKTIKKSKSSAPAKAGQVAPKDIVVPAGPTPFAPGPVIGELGALGIKAGIDGGKVAIKEDAVVAKEGDVIDATKAGILSRLGIQPMEIGLNITGVYEDGIIYDRKTLDIDEDQFLADLTQAAQWSINLSVESGFLTTETAPLVITKAFTDAKGLALEANIINDATRDQILAKAEAQAASVKSHVPDTPKAEPKEEKPKEEEKPEEAKPSEGEAEAPKEEKPAE